jgi:hypothetical protein
MISLVGRRRTLVECQQRIASIPVVGIREEFARSLDHFLAYLGSVPWEPLKLTSPASILGPKGFLEAGTKAHFAFVQNGHTHWGLIWNNKTPRLGRAAACLGGALMRQGVEANDNDLFETIDIRNGQIFSVSTAEIDETYSQFSADFAALESDYLRLIGGS